MKDRKKLDLTFIVATRPEDFKDERTQWTVRHKAMLGYLDNASNDPESTDIRVVRKRKHLSDRFADRHIRHYRPRDPVRSIPSFGQAQAAPENPQKAVRLDVRNPILTASVAQDDLAALAVSMQSLSIGGDTAACESHADAFFSRMEHAGLAPKLPFMTTLPEMPNRNTAARCVNLTLLKVMSGAYFGSEPCSQDWIPLILDTPEAFLSCLCMIAPFADLFTAGKSTTTRIEASDWQQTLAITSIVPQILNDRICDPMKAHDDRSIVSIMQLLYGQLASPFSTCIAPHSRALKHLITLRGGLDHLGGHGVMAQNMVLTEYEIAILTDRTVDLMYSEWMDTKGRSGRPITQPAPESPLFSLGTGMHDLAKEELCSTDTLMLIQSTHDLTEAIVDCPCETGAKWSPRRTERRKKIDALVRALHIYRPRVLGPESSPQDWIYESIRRVALRFAHAVQRQCSLSSRDACHLQLPQGELCGEVTLESIYDAIRGSPTTPLWGRLAGVLYWALLIASASDGRDHLAEDLKFAEPNTPLTPAYSGTYDDHDQPDLVSHETAAPGPTALDEDHIRRPVQRASNVTESSFTQHYPDNGPSPEMQQQVESIFENSSRLLRNYAVESVDKSLQVSMMDQRSGPATSVALDRDDSIPPSTRSSGGTRVSISPDLPAVVGTSMFAINAGTHTRVRAEDTEQAKLLERDRQAREAYAGQCLKSHLLRVSILLRFEHMTAILMSIRRLEKVVSWLRSGPEQGD
ncbi:Hypothetical protein D9617_2g052730 [Elsinoe fawcettii]|nr:Hypothetical protein D9617_2g052730 [Elsinoe fawcettii]